MTTIRCNPKPCEWCNGSMLPGARESFDRWLTRRFCSDECRYQYHAARSDQPNKAKAIALWLLRDKQRRESLGVVVVRRAVWSESGVPTWRVTIKKRDDD